MKVSIPRLRRIRYKDGRTFEVLRPKSFDPLEVADKARQIVIDHATFGPGPYSVAIVVWGDDLATTGRVWNNSSIPGILVPELVRNVLLGLKIESWTIDTLNGK